MTRGSLGVRTSSGTIAAAALEIIAPIGRGHYVKEIEISLVAATATTLGLGRPAAIGVTPTTPVSLLSDAGGEAISLQTKLAVAWGTGPTVPAAFFRRVSLPAVLGTVFKWTFSRGLYIPAGGSLVLWNITGNSVLDVTVSGEE